MARERVAILIRYSQKSSLLPPLPVRYYRTIYIPLISQFRQGISRFPCVSSAVSSSSVRRFRPFHQDEERERWRERGGGEEGRGSFVRFSARARTRYAIDRLLSIASHRVHVFPIPLPPISPRSFFARPLFQHLWKTNQKPCKFGYMQIESRPLIYASVSAVSSRIYFLMLLRNFDGGSNIIYSQRMFPPSRLYE